MDRYWFLTWRTYGTWLPGEEGFVGYYLDTDGSRVIDNIPGEPTTNAIPELERQARERMKGEPVLLVRAQAVALLSQFQETARYRGWVLDAVAVMVNHCHLVYGVLGDPDPSEMLKTWKSYASRALNRLGPKPNAPRWFVDSGSKRRLRSPESRIEKIRYVRDQTAPLLVWLSEEAVQLINTPTGIPGDRRRESPGRRPNPATHVAGSPVTSCYEENTMAKKKSPASVPVEAHRHVADKRPNLPTRETAAFAADDGPQTFVAQRDRSLDPQLVWKGKDEQDARPLEVPAVAIHVQEKIHPQAIVEAVRAWSKQDRPVCDLFSDFNGLDDFSKRLEFYQHDQHWTNRWCGVCWTRCSAVSIFAR